MEDIIIHNILYKLSFFFLDMNWLGSYLWKRDSGPKHEFTKEFLDTLPEQVKAEEVKTDDLRERGSASNAAVFSQCLDTGSSVSLVTHNLEIAPFTREACDEAKLTPTGYRAASPHPPRKNCR